MVCRSVRNERTVPVVVWRIVTACLLIESLRSPLLRRWPVQFTAPKEAECPCRWSLWPSVSPESIVYCDVSCSDLSNLTESSVAWTWWSLDSTMWSVTNCVGVEATYVPAIWLAAATGKEKASTTAPGSHGRKFTIRFGGWRSWLRWT